MAQKDIIKRQIDIYFDYYTERAPTRISKIVCGICSFGIYFSLLGLSWSIPFPHLAFLGQYNSYFNWASFVIAFSIYYYSKLSPTLSYLMLFVTLVFTYSITEINKLELNTEKITSQLYLFILLTCVLLQFATFKTTTKSYTLKMRLLFILIGPIWVINFLLKKH